MRQDRKQRSSPVPRLFVSTLLDPYFVGREKGSIVAIDANISAVSGSERVEAFFGRKIDMRQTTTMTMKRAPSGVKCMRGCGLCGAAEQWLLDQWRARKIFTVLPEASYTYD